MFKPSDSATRTNSSIKWPNHNTVNKINRFPALRDNLSRKAGSCHSFCIPIAIGRQKSTPYLSCHRDKFPAKVPGHYTVLRQVTPTPLQAGPMKYGPCEVFALFHRASLTHKTFAYNIKILVFFYIYYMNEYNENDATHKHRNKRHYGVYTIVVRKAGSDITKMKHKI